MSTPKVYLVGSTSLQNVDLQRYMNDIGGPDWDATADDGETLIEVAGRMCYRSWQPYDPAKPECSNPNVTKVRQGNAEYMKNILKSGHGAILEHVTMTFIARDVSRVFTHEIVRHRVGAAYSQESLRYVRLDQMRAWTPPSAQADPEIEAIWDNTMAFLAGVQKMLASKIKDVTDFSIKKKMTSLDILTRSKTKLSLSQGVATYSYDKKRPITADGIIFKADKALFAAKKKGRNKIEFVKV